ncbi:MAG: 50S ribosomal protein L3 [Candidatus Magasanikbacteria bacterium GW2011_GWA2_45_39]|uniref:50S ribosomal protein L3 n=2 Tax=Candidatus Magasanikiibacteriota TaxID=1752731 RepID=A0A0G1MXZ9_9BACT|nr:MAG: 50S ribosomal protein L3 [Candidatus Magasanikbacteria bacterium GW2011_GWA2_45_39]KKU13246.1 MAG: 50S ribosomal protein L3 [Candidatus Magasanikbacteria bacterium GW2011_GWC2_45_8]
MSQVFAADGTLVPITIVQATPCVVTHIKKKPQENTTALQVGFEEGKAKHIAKPQLGHLKNLPTMRMLREIPLDEKELEGIERGDMITVETFTVGDVVEVTGTSKGRGFQGVVKRHHFRGGPASHGHKDNLRMPGSIGAGGVQRVFKGMRMGGHMGDEQVTIKNLSIIGVDLEKNLLHVKGAIPGGRNGQVLIKGSGELKVTKVKSATPDAPIAEESVVVLPVEAINKEA